MQQVIDIPVPDICPDQEGVFSLQGIPRDHRPPQRVISLYKEAEKEFLHLVQPKGIIKDISISEFTNIYQGQGQNNDETPLETIYQKARHLSLFAATMGAQVSNRIHQLMETKGTDFALGYMLDSIASYCADRSSGFAQNYLKNHLKADHKAPVKVLLYSPGYCGWHVSGQGKLFDYLKPEQIGITINKSYLMTPIKSISGVLVAGSPGIHSFDNNFDFCDLCTTFNCRERINEV